MTVMLGSFSVSRAVSGKASPRYLDIKIVGARAATARSLPTVAARPLCHGHSKLRERARSLGTIGELDQLSDAEPQNA